MAVDRHSDEILRTAIARKLMLRFKYKAGERIVEPHDYGIQNGRIRLLCWQVSGKSSGNLPGWRFFDLEEIEQLEMLERSFAGNRDVSVAHHRWDDIFIRVAPPEGSKVKKAG